MHRKTLGGIYDWHQEYSLCLASGIISWWLWPTKGKVGVVEARPRQAYLVLKVLPITCLMPRTQPRRRVASKRQVRVVVWAPTGREDKGTSQGGGMGTYGKGGQDSGVGRTVWRPWTPGAGYHSLDEHLMCVTSTVQSRKQWVQCPNEVFFLPLNISSLSQTKSSLWCTMALLKPRSKF